MKTFFNFQKMKQRKEKHGDRKTITSNRSSTDSKRRACYTTRERKGKSINMSYVSLLGDSIIDNKVYVKSMFTQESSVLKNTLKISLGMFLIN